jgi:hypothetical protein
MMCRILQASVRIYSLSFEIGVDEMDLVHVLGLNTIVYVNLKYTQLVEIGVDEMELLHILCWILGPNFA